nr:IclR family transcriptional regulator [Sneathiella chinensis]
MTVLEIVAASHDGLSLTDIATLTGFPKPTVHRLTKSLVEAEALTAEDKRQKTFRIGRRMWRILQLGLDDNTLASYAQLACDELSARIQETSYIVRLDRNQIRSVARSAPDQGHRLHVLPGSELPFHAAASAKAILAFQDERTVRRLMKEPFEQLTARTKTSLPDIEAEWEQVRERGYAVCDREIDDTILAYACPVHLEKAGVLYAVGVTGPSSRMAKHPEAYWIEELQKAAQHFAEMLTTLDQ